MRIAPVLLAVMICAWGTDARAQGTTTTSTATTTNGAFTEFVPASKMITVRTETNPAPLRYVVTQQTTIVDENGVPVAVEKISSGSQVVVHYSGTGDQLVASRIVVHKAPVAAERNATTTTTTTRPLTDDEKKSVKKEIENQKEKVEEAADKEKERLDELKDKVEEGGD